MKPIFILGMILMVLLLAVLPAAAQESPPPPGRVDPGEAIPLGPFIFSPAIDLSWESRDNIFFTPRDTVDDTIWTARARLLFELPVLNSYLSFCYTPQYREYKDFDLEENWSHFVDVGGVFEFSNGLHIVPTYRYVSGMLETREVDPGGELMWGDRRFDKNDAGVRLDYWLSPVNGISFEGEFIDIDYDGEPTFRSFYDYSRQWFGAAWLHQLSPTLVMEVWYRHGIFDADTIADFRDSSTDEITVAFRGKINPVLTSTFEIGWRATDLDETAPELIELGYDDYSGLAFRGGLSWELGHQSDLDLDLVRQDYPSGYGLNAFYTHTGGSLRYRLQRERLFGHIQFGYWNNDYDVRDVLTGESRSDDITEIGVGVGYRFNDILSLRASYLYQDRDTTDRLSYDVNTFLVGLTVGF